MESAVTLLPEPLSPTRPTHEPRLTSKDTPSTARSTPSGVLNVVTRSFTWRRGSARRPGPRSRPRSRCSTCPRSDVSRTAARVMRLRLCSSARWAAPHERSRSGALSSPGRLPGSSAARDRLDPRSNRQGLGGALVHREQSARRSLVRRVTRAGRPAPARSAPAFELGERGVHDERALRSHGPPPLQRRGHRALVLRGEQAAPRYPHRPGGRSRSRAPPSSCAVTQLRWGMPSTAAPRLELVDIDAHGARALVLRFPAVGLRRERCSIGFGVGDPRRPRAGAARPTRRCKPGRAHAPRSARYQARWG